MTGLSRADRPRHHWQKGARLPPGVTLARHEPDRSCRIAQLTGERHAPAIRFIVTRYARQLKAIDLCPACLEALPDLPRPDPLTVVGA